MKQLQAENKVYVEFLTNSAVAWFAAGVIAPLFNPPTNELIKFIGPILAMVITFAFLRIATILAKEAE